jgi:regulator of sigma E protease
VYWAGPIMNGVLTVASFTALYVLGWYVHAALHEPPVVGIVEAGSPAEAAGLRTGDLIVAIGGEPQSTWEDVILTIGLRPETDLGIRYRRGTDEREVRVRSRNDPKGGDIGVYPLVRIGEIMAAPARDAGLLVDDAILAIDGKPIRTFGDVLPLIRGSGDKPLAMDILRGSVERRTVTVTPQDGKIGIAEKRIVKKFPLPAAFREAVTETKRWTIQTVTMLGQLMRAQISPKNTLSGPVQIYQASGQAARGGVRSVLWLVALLSLSVGILNLLPVPPLDGGHLAILYVEAIARRDLGVQAKTWIINVGVILVLVLIVSVVYFDLTKTDWFNNLFGTKQ